MMMPQREKQHWCAGSRNGLTLIEVVVGITIAGTLLVTTILAASSHHRQLRRSQEKKLAVIAVDRFLSAWAVTNFRSETLSQAASVSGVALEDAANEDGASDHRSEYFRVSITARSVSDIPELPLEVLKVSAFAKDGSKPALCWIEVLRRGVPPS